MRVNVIARLGLFELSFSGSTTKAQPFYGLLSWPLSIVFLATYTEAPQSLLEKEVALDLPGVLVFH